MPITISQKAQKHIEKKTVTSMKTKISRFLYIYDKLLTDLFIYSYFQD